MAKATEDLGFDAFFRSDHYLRMGSGDGLPGPTDAWITLAGLARETKRIRLGTLMSAATFRLPGVLAIQVAGVDQMSGGRVELGLGAGWFEEEHKAYGIPFPKEKFARLEEQLAIVTGLWATEAYQTFSHHGTYYDLTDSPALPKPAQAKVPVLIGGHGASRTPRLAAQFADEFNMPFASIEDTERQFGRVRAAAEQAGRKGDDLVYSNALVVCAGEGRRGGRPPRRRDRPRGGRPEGQRPGKLPGRDRRQDRPLRADRRPAHLPPDPRPRRPGPPGTALVAGPVPAVVRKAGPLPTGGGPLSLPFLLCLSNPVPP